MRRVLLAATLILTTSSVFAQEGRIKVHSWGADDFTPPPVSNPQPLRILKVNGFVPGYTPQGQPLNGTEIHFVFVDQQGRQVAAMGKGIPSITPDHKISITHFDGYIEAARVGMFMIANTRKASDGSVIGYRGMSTTPVISLTPQTRPSKGIAVEE